MNYIAGGLPAKTKAQKVACISEFEALAVILIERGAYPGVVAPALAEFAIRVSEEAKRAGPRFISGGPGGSSDHSD